MKRPIVMVSVIWGIGLFLGLGEVYMAAFVAMFFCFLFVKLDKKIEVRHICLVLLLCLFSMFRVILFDSSYEEERNLFEDGDTVVVQGIVKDVIDNDTYYKYVIDDWKTGSGIKGKFLINVYAQVRYDIGDKVTVRGNTLAISQTRNPGGFNALNYYKQKRVSYLIFGKLTFVEHTDSYPLRALFRALRMEHYKQLHQLLPNEEADIVATLLLGMDKVEEETYVKFKEAGLIHLLAISGLHISILILALYSVLKRLSSHKIAGAIALSFGVIYCFYTGMHLSTIRATLMVAFFLLGKAFDKRYDKATSLSLSAMLMLTVNPYYVLNVGFMLSFASVSGIFFLVPVLKKILPRYNNVLADSIRTMIAVQIIIGPILMYYFYEIPIYSLIANLLVMPVIPLLLAVAIIALVVSYLFIDLAVILSGTVYWLIRFVLWVTDVIDLLPLKSVLTGEPHLISIILYTMLILFIMIGVKKSKVSFLTFVLVIQVITVGFYHNDTLKMTVLDVGQGDCSIIEAYGKVIMIDGGGLVNQSGDKNVGQRVIKPFLKSQGIRKIDTLFISHGDFDHIYGIIELASEVQIGQVFLAENDWSGQSDMIEQLLNELDENTQIYYMTAGDLWKYNALSIDCLGPNESGTYDNANEASMILLLSYGDFDGLYLGDVSVLQERQLADVLLLENRVIDFVKVAHHGADTSTSEFLYETIRPMLSVISVGENNYGHPSKEVLSILEENSGEVITTFDAGAILIESNGNTIHYRTMLQDD